MSIQSEITRLTEAKSDIAAAIKEKGVTVSSTATLDTFASLIAAIESGGKKVAFGTISGGMTASAKTVTHGLGVVPNAIFVIDLAGQRYANKSLLWGCSQSAAGYLIPSYTAKSATAAAGSSSTTLTVTYATSTSQKVSTKTAWNGVPYAATTTTFKFSGASGTYTMGTFLWIAIAD